MIRRKLCPKNYSLKGENIVGWYAGKDAHCIYIRRLVGKSHKEIAEELGISVKGVEYHISKAVKLLRDNLKEYAPFLIFFI